MTLTSMRLNERYRTVEAILFFRGTESTILNVADMTGNILFEFLVLDPTFYNEINSGRLRYPIHLVDRGGMIGLVYDVY